MTILLAALSIGTKTYFSCSSCKYSITVSCFNVGFVLWTFTRCFREIILFLTSYRILGFVGTIRSMLEYKPISISPLHLFQFTDIASRTLGLLLTSFLDLVVVVILRLTVKIWPWFSLTKSLCYWQSHSPMPMSYVISSFV